MGRRIVFTIVSRNYTAQAKVLMQSVAHYEPDCERVIIASDGLLDGFDPELAVVIEPRVFVYRVDQLSLYYDAVEFNTAIKPSAFIYIFAKFGAEAVVYLDPDTALFAPIDPVFEALHAANLVLTPHLWEPLSPGMTPDDLTVLRSGGYNLGFIGLGRSEETDRFLAWWARKLQFDCRVDFAAGLFTDQRWIDLAPGLFDSVAILRDPGLNLAYWNLPGRVLARTELGWTVEGAPLRFFHFSGFSPLRPDILSKYQNRLWPAPEEPLGRLLGGYAKALMDAGYATSSRIAYRFDRLGDGRKLTRLMRRALLWEARRGGVFPDLADGQISSWLDAPDPSARADRGPKPTRVMMQFLRETEGGAGYQPWSSMEQAFDLFEAHGAKLGADAGSLAAARLARADAAAAPGSLGPKSAELAVDMDLPEAFAALWRSRSDLQSSFPVAMLREPDAFAAYALGPAALAGDFAVSTVSGWFAGLEDDRLRRLARRAADYAAGTGDSAACLDEVEPDLLDVVAAFGLGPRAAWPRTVLRRLEGMISMGGRADAGVPLPAFAMLVWRRRPDLQVAFDIKKPDRRIAFYRWLLIAGVKEYALHRPALRARAPFHFALAVALNRLKLPSLQRLP